MTKDFKFFNKYFYLPIISLPILMITGPFLSDFIISVTGIFFLFFSIKCKQFFFFNNVFTKYFLIFYLFISILFFFYEENLFYNLLKPLSMIRFILFVAAVNFLIKYNTNFLNNFFMIIVTCYFILLIDALIQLYIGKNILGYDLSPTGRVSSFFNDELIMGSYATRLFPLLVALILYKKFKNQIFVLSFFFALCFFLVLLSGERTALVLLLLFVVLFILFSSKVFKKKLLFIFAIILILLSIIFLNVSFKTRFLDSSLFFFLGKNSNHKIKIISDEHQALYYTAYNLFLKEPVIGNGINSFKKLCKTIEYNEKEEKFYNNFKCSSHPHNIYLQLLSETGIVSFLLIISLYIFLIIKLLFYKNKLENYHLSLLLSFIITLFPFAPSGNMFNNWLSIMYFLPVAFYLGLSQKLNKKI